LGYCLLPCEDNDFYLSIMFAGSNKIVIIAVIVINNVENVILCC
jgi:hypothetical protein